MKIFLVTPFPHWVDIKEVDIKEEDKMPGGCFIILILLLLGLYFLTNLK